jgi:hypothetical protein
LSRPVARKTSTKTDLGGSRAYRSPSANFHIYTKAKHQCFVFRLEKSSDDFAEGVHDDFLARGKVQ